MKNLGELLKKTGWMLPALVMAGLLITVILCDLWSTEIWLMEVLSNFRLYFLITLPVAAIAGWILSSDRRRKLINLGIFALAAVWTVIPFYMISAEHSSLNGKGEPDLKVCFFNGLIDNKEKTEAVGDLLELDVDILAIAEFNEEWKLASEKLSARFPYSSIQVRDDYYGMAVFSKIPWDSMVWNEFQEWDIPTARLTINISGKPVSVNFIHPPSPKYISSWKVRNNYYNWLIENIKPDGNPTILAGDFNITAWTPWFRSIIKSGNWKLAQCSADMTPTYKSAIPGIEFPLDHCLVSENIQCIRKVTGPYSGSDHRLLIWDLLLPEAGIQQFTAAE